MPECTSRAWVNSQGITSSNYGGAIKYFVTTATNYWMRSPYYQNSANASGKFCVVIGGGILSSRDASDTNGFVPVFRIG